MIGNLLAVLLLLVLGRLGFGQEKALKPPEVPGRLAAAVLKLFPKGTIINWSKETENGKTTYEASVTDDAGKRDVVLTREGSLVAIEEAIAVSDLPARAKGAVLAKYPHRTIGSAEKISHDGQVDYEVDLAKTPRREITVSGEGKILREE